jgi:hypothetical protein
MGTTEVEDKKKLSEEHEPPLKGTWFSVGVVAAGIFVTYLLVYGLYMARV